MTEGQEFFLWMLMVSIIIWPIMILVVFPITDQLWAAFKKLVAAAIDATAPVVFFIYDLSLWLYDKVVYYGLGIVMWIYILIYDFIQDRIHK